MNKLLPILMGVILVVFGIAIILNPRFHDTRHDHHYDFTPISIPFGVFLIVVGIIFVYFALRKRMTSVPDTVSICPKCQDPFEENKLAQQRCPKCGSDLDKLEGYYERHPELRIPEHKHPEPKT